MGEGDDGDAELGWRNYVVLPQPPTQQRQTIAAAAKASVSKELATSE
jgi:hypothetical protein